MSFNENTNMQRRSIVAVIADILIMACLIALDRYSKYLAVIYLKDNKPLVLLKGIFELNYLENRGAAFGIMQDMKLFFLIVAVLMVLFVLYALIRLPKGGRYALMEICLLLIGAGAIGNMIDRVTTEYVVDFFYFVLINFPIFNVADIYVTVACIVLIIGILFVYKEEDLKFLSLKTKYAKNNKSDISDISDISDASDANDTGVAGDKTTV